MTPDDTEQGRMNLWDKVFTAVLQGGQPVEAAIAAAGRAVDAFEERFHADMVKARKELGTLISGEGSSV